MEILEQTQHLTDEELLTLATSTTGDRAEYFYAAIHHRKNAAKTPENQKPENYRLIYSTVNTKGEDSELIAVFEAAHMPGHLHENAPPVRFHYDRATPEQVEEYERQVDGEDERTAIFKAAAENGIHFRPETPPSDYSPTGRCYFTRPQIQTAGPLVIVYQSSAIDN